MGNAPADIVEKIPTARQVVGVRIESEPRRAGISPRKTEVHLYVVTGPKGLRRLSAKRLAKIIRGHWGIENRLHHVLDRTLREDAQKTRVGEGAVTLSLLRKLSISILNNLLPKSYSDKYLPEVQAILAAKPRKLLNVLNKPYWR